MRLIRIDGGENFSAAATPNDDTAGRQERPTYRPVGGARTLMP